MDASSNPNLAALASQFKATVKQLEATSLQAGLEGFRIFSQEVDKIGQSLHSQPPDSPSMLLTALGATKIFSDILSQPKDDKSIWIESLGLFIYPDRRVWRLQDSDVEHSFDGSLTCPYQANQSDKETSTDMYHPTPDMCTEQVCRLP